MFIKWTASVLNKPDFLISFCIELLTAIPVEVQVAKSKSFVTQILVEFSVNSTSESPELPFPLTLSSPISEQDALRAPLCKAAAEIAALLRLF
jgi:hypothetical protein